VARWATAWQIPIVRLIDRTVCWLIRDSLNTPSAMEALARAQAVRFRIVDNNRRVAQPWHDSPGSAPADSPHIEVFTAIATRPRDLLTPGEA
jgi:hypothetical protein